MACNVVIRSFVPKIVDESRTLKPVSPNHPLRSLFTDVIGVSLEETKAPVSPEVGVYLVDLLVRFIHTESLFAIQREGRPVVSVIEMAAEGDVRLNADSFERERQVHRHIGDYILFWSAVYPDFLTRLRTGEGLDLICDYTERGKQSYYVVSTFEHHPFGEEAPLFRELSEKFERCSDALSLATQRLPYSA